MKPEPLQAAIRDVPFRPFSIILADGERLPVPSPECLWLLPKGRIVAWCDQATEQRFFDISLLLGIEMDDDQC